MKAKDIEFQHHQPRSLDKRKRHRAGFSEDVQETRKNRISFKNYVRQIDDERLATELFAEESWVVELRDESSDEWQEIAGPFLVEEDAWDELDTLNENADKDQQYRVTRIDN